MGWHVGQAWPAPDERGDTRTAAGVNALFLAGEAGGVGGGAHLRASPSVRKTPRWASVCQLEGEMGISSFQHVDTAQMHGSAIALEEALGESLPLGRI